MGSMFNGAKNLKYDKMYSSSFKHATENQYEPTVLKCLCLCSSEN